VVPIAAEILASRQAGAATETALVAIINGSMDKIITERNLVARAASWQPEERMERGLVTPIHVAALDFDRQRERERFRRRGTSDEFIRGRHASDAGAEVGVPLPQFVRQRQHSDNFGVVERTSPAESRKVDGGATRGTAASQSLSLFSGMSLGGTKQ
jgi:hypothetical protein